jgi:YidC/Oxa1 family membrane protein insertase
MKWDWKILVVIVIGLAIFGIFKLCSDDEPDYDAQQQEQQQAREQAHQNEQASEDQKRRADALEKAREARGERKPEQMVELETAEFLATFTTRGGSLRSFKLKDPQYLEPPLDPQTGVRNEDAEEYVPVDLVSTNPENHPQYNPLQFKIHKYEGEALDALLPDADYELIENTEDKVVFRYQQPGIPIAITKKFEIDRDSGPYQLWLTTRVTNRGDSKITFNAGVNQAGYQHESEAGGGFFSKQPNLLSGICKHGDALERRPWNDSDYWNTYNGVGVGFTGVETNYFLAAMLPGDDSPTTCNIRPDVRTSGGEPAWGVFVAELRWGETELNPGESHTFKIKNYFGPKKYALLQTVGNNLHESVDFGWFWPISRVLLWLLLKFQSVVVNWGVAIILLTLVVKLVLMPLTHKSFKSADRMKALKPEVDVINEKYKDEPQKKQQEVMALYKRNKVNPLGGCLPTLLQMPIWIALFRTLRAAPELYRAPFFGWIQDLSNPDPYFITPVVMGALMFLQQRITPMTGDSAQAKMMMYFMPIMFTAFMLFLPSGLTLYILVNTVLSIAHQTIIQRLRTKKAAAGGAS